jgi:transcriptional antiterminator RfaH
MKNWILLQTKLRKEDFLWGEICARGIECFYPKIKVITINPRARKIRPYFPGYLFVNIDSASASAAELRWLPGASGWVRFGESPAAVPDSVVEGIRRHVDALNEGGGVAAVKRMKPGQAVEIMEGPFAGYEAVFDAHLSGNARVRVLLKLLKSQQLPVEMPASLLRIKKRS